MILDSTSGAHENVDSFPEVPGLALNVDTSVDCDNLELIMVMLQLCQLSSDLDCQFSSWCEDDCLNFSSAEKIVFSEVLDGGKTEGEGFA